MAFIKGSDGIARSLKENKDVTYRYADSDVTTLLSSFGSNTVVTTGNVTAANFIGEVTGNVSGSAATATSATSATTAGTVTTAAQANITSVGTLTSVTVTGNVTGGNLIATGQVVSTGNVTGVNLVINTISSDDSTFVVINDGLDVKGDLESTGDITGANVIVSLGGFVKNPVYTISTLTAITGQVGWVAVVSDSATTNGMLAFWDTTNSRWSYVLDNSAVV